jgi:hypothetical protein
LPYYLWSDFAFGVVPALASPPPRFVHKNYDTATHQTVYERVRIFEIEFTFTLVPSIVLAATTRHFEYSGSR